MFITERELREARLAAGKKGGESHILRELLQEDAQSGKKKRMREGERYYRGEHDVLQKDFRQSPISEAGRRPGEETIRTFFNPNRSNHHCVNPFHHTLVAQKAAYLVGREPTVAVRGQGADYAAFEQALEGLTDEEFNRTLTRWITGAANKGVEYLHIYYDEEGEFRYCIVPAEEVLVVTDEAHQQDIREVIRYYDIKVREDGKERARRRVEWWTGENVTYYTETGGGGFLKDDEKAHWTVTELVDGEERKTTPHGWGRPPFIPLRNNEAEMTDLQLVKGLIDAYDYISSEGTNNLLDLVNLY